jgi:hypothetical protein
MVDNMELKEAKEILKEKGYLLEDKAADDYDTFEEYLKDFKEELLFQYMTPEIGERKYNKIISNKELLQEIKDNWANGDYCPSEMVEYILDNDLDESYQDALAESASIMSSDIEKNTIYDEEYEIYSGKLNNFWWSFSESFAMSKSDFSGKGRQYKVSAGIMGKPKTRKVLATKANFSNVYQLVADYLNKIKTLDEDFTQGVGAPLGADQGIPHSMQGCAVPMMRLGEPAPYGKIQKPCPGHRPPRPHQRHRPIGFFPVGMLMTPVVVRKKKKKKKKK